MLPKWKQFKNWNLPSKYSVFGFWVSLILFVISYFFPINIWTKFLNKSDIVVVPGNNSIEQRINKAKMEGVKYTDASSESFESKFINLPMLNKASKPSVIGYDDTFALLSSVSPVRIVNSNMYFEPGQCRFGAEATNIDTEHAKVGFLVKTLSCVDSQQNAYELIAGDLGLYSLGYIANLTDRSKNNLSIATHDDGYQTIDPEHNVLVMLNEPLMELDYKGKSVVKF